MMNSAPECLSRSICHKKLKKAILVKDSALSTDQLGKYLYVVNDSDKIVYTCIHWSALSRFSESDPFRHLPDSRYVTKAMLKVTDGMKVKPVIVK